MVFSCSNRDNWSVSFVCVCFVFLGCVFSPQYTVRCLWQVLLEELEAKVAGLWTKIYDESNSAIAEGLVKEKDAGEARVAKLYAEVGSPHKKNVDKIPLGWSRRF